MATVGELQQVDVLLKDFKVKESSEDEASTAYGQAKAALSQAQEAVQAASEALESAKSDAAASLKALKDFVDALTP